MMQIKAGVVSNPILDRLPSHLLQYVKPQYYDRYTAVDQAVWRYVMRKNVHSLVDMAHESYLKGLERTGISMHEIPSMYGMNRILEKIGWAAVAVDGLIPTRAFLEFQAYNVLVIASEIRTVDEIEYTPIPDIIHESAGHAPIIANPEYAEFLRRMGQLGSKAISSAHDAGLEKAARHLTSLKESATATKVEIDQATEELQHWQVKKTLDSEMSGIRNLHWWSVEYGLIGQMNKPRIYGAGLLSSIGESTWCMSDHVKKLPYTLEAATTMFDYTKPQPQLFVTPDFAHLSLILEEFADGMGVRTGGASALAKLVDSNEIGTIELSTGIQISGKFQKFSTTDRGAVSFFMTEGSSSLAYRDREILGHGVDTYRNGYCSPIGKLKGINLAIEDMSPRDLEIYHIYEGRDVELIFEGGAIIKGRVITGIRNLQGKIILIRFRNCSVTQNGITYFSPADGIFNMVVGKGVMSGYAGPADLNSFDLIHHVVDDLAVEQKSDDRDQIYAAVQKLQTKKDDSDVLEIWQKIKGNFSEEWLVMLELCNALDSSNSHLKDEITLRLEAVATAKPEVSHLIRDGLTMIK